MRTRKWVDQQTGEHKQLTEIQGDILQMLDSKNSQNAQANTQPNAQARTQTSKNNSYAQAKNGNYTPPPQNGDFDDVIPF